MIHLPDIIQDLGLILSAAAVVTILSKMLKQPAVLGYLIAGFLVSRHVSFLPTVKDEASIKVWAEIGVIFLLFGLGLEFSFKKLAKVGKSASVTALFEIVFMIICGYALGQALGWSSMDSLFLGGILSVSSTTIIVRAFSELGMKGNRFVSVVFGVLIVEDLVAILLLVLLSTLAITNSFSGSQLAGSTAKLGFFLALWFVVGIYVIPIFLKKLKRYLNDETALIVSIGLCLSMVILAVSVGFSPALGAFVMGSILAETSEGKRIEHLIAPVKDLFGAVFFVSVGMLIDPSILGEHWYAIIAVTLVTIFGKLFSSSLGALLSGESLKVSVQSGMSLAQIGEFSFIIATLGLTLNVTSDFLYPIAVSASAITTFTTPYLIQISLPVYEKLESILPPSFLHKLNAYQQAVSKTSGDGLMTHLTKVYAGKILINGVLVVAISLFSQWALAKKVPTEILSQAWFPISYGFTVLFLASPFLWAIAVGSPKVQGKSNLPMETARALKMGVQLVRGLIAGGFVLLLLIPLQLGMGVSLFLFAATIVLLFVWNRFAKRVYRAVEDQFMANLNQKDESKPVLAPWDASLAEFILSPDSPLVAKTLEESKLKETFGITIGVIERGAKQIFAPQRSERLLPFDKLFLIGTDEQLSKAKEAIEATSGPKGEPIEGFGLELIQLHSESPFVGKSIRTCGIREKVNGLIVGIEREGNRILNPDSSFDLRSGDNVWIVGETEKIRSLTLLTSS